MSNTNGSIPQRDPRTKSMDAKMLVSMPSSLKESLKETGNASQYLRSAAQNRMRSAREALSLLESDDWSESEILAVCDVLNGFAVTYSMPLGEQIAAEMEDAARLNSTHEKWDVPASRWGKLAEHVREQEPLARALRDVAAEWWGPSDHLPLGSRVESDDG